MKKEFIRVGKYFDIKNLREVTRNEVADYIVAPVCASDARGTMKRGSAASGSSTGTD